MRIQKRNLRTGLVTLAVVAFGFIGGPAGASPPSPVIHAMLTGDVVRAVDFTPSASVTLTIYASAGGAILYGPVTRTTNGDGSYFSDRGEHGVDLVAGRHIVITDNATGVTKALTLAAVTIDSVDQATNIVSGRAPSGTVHVFVTGPGPSFPAALDATADGTGAWSADFDSVGFDIVEGNGAKAHFDDPEGDVTVYDTANPNVHASLTSDWVNLHNWLPGSTLTVDIGGTMRTVIASAAGFASIQRPMHAVDLVPGTLITATDGAVTKTNRLEALSIDGLDASNDVVSGTAQPGRMVNAVIHGDGGAPLGSSNVTANPSGAWSADFTGIVDVTPGMGADAGVADPENDNTVAELFLPQSQASFEGNLSFDSASGCGFAPNSMVTVIVKDPQGTPRFNEPVSTNGGGCFEVGFGFDLVPMWFISVDDGVVMKDLTLVDLTIDNIDPGTNTVSGTAPPNSTFNVDADTVGDGSGWQGLSATSGGNGDWDVDFDTIGVDLTPSTHVGANIGDLDGDQTATDFMPFEDQCPDQPDFTDPNAFRSAITGLGTPTVVDFEDMDPEPGNSLEGRSEFAPDTYADKGATFSNSDNVPLYVAPGGLAPHCDPSQDGCPVWNESNSLSVGEFPFPAEVVDHNDDDLLVRLDPPRVAVGFTLVDNASQRLDEYIQYLDADGVVIEQFCLPPDFAPFRAFAGFVSHGRPIAAINIVEGMDDGDDVDYDDFILVPPPTPDFAPGKPIVTPLQIRTDYGPTPVYTAWTRTIDVDVSNVGGVAGDAGLEVWVRSNTDGVRTLIGTTMLHLGAGRTARETFDWNGFGIVGDVTVEARTCSPKDQNPGNDKAKVGQYVIAGGTGFGVTGPVTFGAPSTVSRVCAA